MKTALTEQTIMKTRQWFADHNQRCIDEVESGVVKVNDKESYYQWRRDMAAEALAGGQDHIFTFIQRAHYIQTGDMVALMA